jgi:hypothetical protein
MSAVVRVLAVIGVAFAVAGAAVLLGDRQTTVPPPDAVGEGFTRLVVAGRYELAMRHLSRDLRRHTTPDDLDATFGAIRLTIGDPDTVDGTLEWFDDSRAAARATVSADCGTAVLELRFTRERGLWVISELPTRSAIGFSGRRCPIVH